MAGAAAAPSQKTPTILARCLAPFCDSSASPDTFYDLGRGWLVVTESLPKMRAAIIIAEHNART
eukprot:1274730-Prymnesium_polylepis.1